jgi:hypothetical protein
MPVLATIPSRDYPEGAWTFGPVAVPVGARRARVRLSREGWADLGATSEVVRVLIEGSPDGGQTWRRLMGFSTAGGVVLFDGEVALETWGRCRLPQPENPDRMLRARVQALVTLRTALTLEVE